MVVVVVFVDEGSVAAVGWVDSSPLASAAGS